MKNRKLVESINKITSGYYVIKSRDLNKPCFRSIQYIPTNINEDSKFYNYVTFNGRIVFASVHFNDEEHEKESIFYSVDGDKLTRIEEYTIDENNYLGCIIGPYLIESIIDDISSGDSVISVINLDNKKVIYYKDNTHDKVLGYIETHKGQKRDYETLKFKQGSSIDVIKPITKATFVKNVKLIENELLKDDFFNGKSIEVDFSK